jgi:hypothetical protein
MQSALGHAVEARDDRVGYKGEATDRTSERRRQRLDMAIIIIGWKDAQRRLPAQARHMRLDGIANTCGRCGAILRIKRRNENAATSCRKKRVDAVRDRAAAIAHRMRNHRVTSERSLKRPCLAAGDRGERRAL